ncbi:MAG: hypothetical protein K6A78_00590 [Prevotella sp.]|nr:hypothetical protein [Prevotella sp.]
MNNRYYANVQGANPKAILACLKKANEIIANDPDVDRIVLYSYTKHNFDTVAQIFGDSVDRMFSQPLSFNGIAKPVQCLTERTYKDWAQQPNIVICCHMDSKAVQKVDDFRSAKYIMAVSWLKDGVAEWVKRWNAEFLYGDEIQEMKKEDDELTLLRIALEEMDIRMCGSKDFHHPDDENACKTYIRTIHKYMSEVTSSQIEDILVTELNWTNDNAAQVGELLNRLKSGHTFRGGDKTGLVNYYKGWKNKLAGGA